MKRNLMTALLPFATTSLMIVTGSTTSGATETEAASGCALPTAERAYTRDMLTYRLEMDLTNCDWWDGSPVQLDGTVERVDPTDGGHGVGSLVMCAALTPRHSTAPSAEEATLSTPDGTDGGDPEKAEPAAPLRSGLCAIEIAVEHPSPEAAHYTGEITFPWQGGRRAVSFNALCGGNAAGCVDLPIDPMTSLAPLGDAIDGIGNGN